MAFLVTKRVSGHTYYYLRHNHWVNGQTRTSWETYLGTLSDLGKLLPAVGGAQPIFPSLQARVTEFGCVAALWDLAQRLDIQGIIDAHAAGIRGGLTVGQYMVLAAINRCVGPCSKRAMSDWYDQTALRRWITARASQLSSQRFWEAMGRLDEEKLRAIELEIDRRLIERFGIGTECLAYDATNFFTYIDTETPSQLARRGHNKERRIDLRQISLALLVSRDFHIPLLHEAYPGNRPDAPEFSGVVQELVRRQQMLGQAVQEITVVFDKGNNSRDNIEKLKFHFVGSLVPTQHKDLLAVPLEQFVPLEGAGLEGLTAWRVEKEVFGRSVAIVMTYNPTLFQKQWRGLGWHMGKCEKGLRELQEKLTRWRQGAGKGKRSNPQAQVAGLLKARHMKQVYDVKVQEAAEGPQFAWTQNQAELTRLREHLFGRTLIFTDQKGWTNAQIVLAYRGQYQVEQAFHWMKAPGIARWWPMHHWTDEKIRVHAFYCVLALTLLSLLRREIVGFGYDWGIEKILDVLGTIREVELLGKPGSRSTLLTQMSRECKALYGKLKLERYRTS